MVTLSVILRSRLFLSLLWLTYLSVPALPAISQTETKPCGTSVLTKRHINSIGDKSRKKTPKRENFYSGEKKGLIILVEFPDIAFQENARQTWTDLANMNGYSDNYAPGSVSDYFFDQSYNQFRLTFDVVGPVMASQTHDYYGSNIDWGAPTGWFDQNVGELVEEMCKGVADQVRFSDYDWDGDGEVEQVFLLYAGHGENDYWSKDSTVIWPHMASLSLDWKGYEEGLIIQDVRIDTYACSNEIDRSDDLAGIGTFCHEFSHCLGLPDLYDTENGTSVLGRYDVMDQGNYNGNSWCPVGFSSYERYSCGWLEPEVISDPTLVVSTDNTVRDIDSDELRPLHLYPDAFLYRVSEDASDYYLIEYRRKKSWDKYIPTEGLMAWHIDFDEEAWINNEVNNDPDHLRVVRLKVDQIPSGILDISYDNKKVKGYYDLKGNALSSPNHPFIIIRYNDGTTKKCIR